MNFKDNNTEKLSSPRHAVIGTKSDTVALQIASRGFMVATDGNIKCVLAGDTLVTDAVTLAVLAGVQYHIALKQIFTTDTTAGVVHLLV